MTGPAIRTCGGSLGFAEELDRFVSSETPLDELFDVEEEPEEEEEADE